MAQEPKYTAYGVMELPTSNIDIGGVYFKFEDKNRFSAHIRNNGNTDWLELSSAEFTLNRLNGLDGDVETSLSFDNGDLSITYSNNNNPDVIKTVNLDGRYWKIGDSIPWGDIVGAPNFALDSEVLHKTGNETKSGTLTFEDSPKVPTPEQDEDAVNKKYVDDIEDGLQDQIDDIEQAIGAVLVLIDEIDASTNPNFPSNPEGTKAGDSWVVTKAGKVGGVNGRQVDVGNFIIAKVDGANPGNYDDSKDDWIILQSDLDQATEIVAGFIRIATQAEAIDGTNDTAAITPKKLRTVLDNLVTLLNDTFVRFDINTQGLDVIEQANARENIDAASTADLRWGIKEW